MISPAPEEETPLVFVVDDDDEVRAAIRELMLSVGIEAACCGSTRDLMDSPLFERPGCIVLDVRMPGASGLDLQQHLRSEEHTSELQSRENIVCRLLLEKKKNRCRIE